MNLRKKKTTTGKKSMMKMRKEPLLNRCAHNLVIKSGKIQLPSKYPMMVKNHRDQGEEGANRKMTRSKLASITKTDSLQMKQMTTTLEAQRLGQTTKMVINT